MAFDRREHARLYEAREGDTLRAIAERETAAGNPITWQELARFNWGTEDEAEVDAFLRDELGARKRGSDNRFVLSLEDEPRGRLLIPERFKLPQLALERTYTLHLRRKVAPAQFLGCCSLPGITFAFNSSFIRPTVVEHLGKLEALATEHPEARIMIFGHTDAVGDELYNKKLSERRAWSVYAFITNDPDAWEVLYNHEDETWGVPVLQEILADLGHDPGPADGEWGSRTRAAARDFLGLGEEADVQNDPGFRAELFAAYMAGKHDIDLPPERFLDPGYMGCGEFSPMVTTEDALEANRRVTFFFFHPDRLPRLPCAYADIAPCHKQMVDLDRRHTKGFACSFYDSLSVRCRPEVKPIPPGFIEIILDDPFFGRYAGVDVGITFADGGQRQAQTDNDGVLLVEEDRGKYADLEYRCGMRPMRQRVFLKPPGADSEAGAWQRLVNLGYVRHPEPGEAPENAEDYTVVLRSFQADHFLAPSGEMEAETRQALVLAHGEDYHSWRDRIPVDDVVVPENPPEPKAEAS